jgi:hypothetical protein
VGKKRWTWIPSFKPAYSGRNGIKGRKRGVKEDIKVKCGGVHL